MEFYRARPKLPPELSGLLTSELRTAIEEANIDPVDRNIAMLYFIDHIPQIDIAAELNCGRKTISRRAAAVLPSISSAASRLRLPQ